MDLIQIQNKIYTIREQKVMLDYDLAALYEVETRVLNQSVKRNLKRFPPDFMFQLTVKEWEGMSSQIVMTSTSKRPKTAIPYAFTEQGLSMLSGILNSDKAIEIFLNTNNTKIPEFRFAASGMTKSASACVIPAKAGIHKYKYAKRQN
jgi:hypothetical protein